MLLMARPVQPAFRAKRPARSTILNAVIAVVAVLMFGATFRAGINRGMDHKWSVRKATGAFSMQFQRS